MAWKALLLEDPCIYNPTISNYVSVIIENANKFCLLVNYNRTGFVQYFLLLGNIFMTKTAHMWSRTGILVAF